MKKPKKPSRSQLALLERVGERGIAYATGTHITTVMAVRREGWIKALDHGYDGLTEAGRAVLKESKCQTG